MRHKINYQAIPITILVVLLGGCSSLATVDPLVTSTADSPTSLDENPIDLDKSPYKRLYENALSNATDRITLQSHLLLKSDVLCNKHKANIFSNASTINVVGGVVTTGLAAAGGLVTGQLAANALSGSASFISGTQSIVNENVYQNLLAAAIIAEIAGNRDTQLGTIMERRKDSASYTVNDAIRDAQKYHDLCSFYEGVVSLVKKAGKQEMTTPDLAARKENCAGGRVYKSENRT